MTILLLGSGPRLSWSQAILAAIRQRSGSQSGSAVRLVDGVPTRELLQSLLAEAPLDLIVIDPPRLSCSEQDGTAFLDLLRLEGSRAVFTFELSRRARRVVRLANGTIDGESWIARLVACAGMPATVRPAELLRLFHRRQRLIRAARPAVNRLRGSQRSSVTSWTRFVLRHHQHPHHHSPWHGRANCSWTAILPVSPCRQSLKLRAALVSLLTDPICRCQEGSGKPQPFSVSVRTSARCLLSSKLTLLASCRAASLKPIAEASSLCR